MKTTQYPSLEEALYLHSQLIERFGGSSGVRDYGLLESALARPRSTYYETLCEQAAALMQSLARNHVFVDGSKWMSFALTAVFLKLNAYQLRVKASEAEAFIVEKIIAGHSEVPEIALWLESHITPC